MSRCIVVHPTGAIELEDFHPRLHQRLRGLGYKRFVIQFVRNTDQRMLSAPIYARVTPSAWHMSEAGRKLSGPRAGVVSIVDEHGDAVDHAPEPLAVAETTEGSGTPPPSSAGAEAAPEGPLASVHARMRAMDAAAIGHRLRSLTHHWLYLVDRNDGDATPFDDLIATTFDLDWSPTGIRTRAALSAWYRELSERVLKSSHTLARLQYEVRDRERYGVRLELHWYGFTRVQPELELEGRTLHEWTVSDDPSDRFARIENAKTKVLLPAQPRAR
jgi:hypothetical protein